jgi:uncharacterized protein (TIGR02246 family)
VLKRMKLRGVLVLALGALFGWAATTGHLGFSPPAQGADEKKEAIEFVVRLPADATLEIDGNKTQETGAVRTFVTPPLPTGGHYRYTLKATSQGKEVTRQIHIAHGVDNSFDLRAEFLQAATSKAEAKQITGAGSKAPGGDAPVPVNDNPKEADALLKNAEGFVEAFHKGDAAALAAFWTKDGNYTTQTGRRLEGRDAIEKAFKEYFAENKGLKLRIDSDALRFLTPEVAVEDGTTEVIPPDGTPPSRARYTTVHVKKDGKWYLSSVRDAPYAAPSNYEHLRGLEWAIGEWADEGEKGEVARVSFAWAENQNFIVSTFATTIKNIAVGGGTQWIGWDPAARKVRAWTFDNDGGFGEAVWTKDGNKWVVKTTATLRDGKRASSTNTITKVDADTVTWQSTDRTLDGKAVPDIKEVRMKRVK